jgi:hypothetical protein
MWLGPLLFVAVSVFLWKYIGAVFVPELMARSVFALIPALGDLQLVVLINAAILYFGVYFAFAIFWTRLKPYFGNVFVAAMALWLANMILLFPILGRGILGYRTPQGWFAVSVPTLLAHWMFARGLQFQDRRS